MQNRLNNKDLKLPLADKLKKNEILAGEEHEHEGESHDEHAKHEEGSKDPSCVVRSRIR
ncbi:Uncharacterised protein [Staphylococcus gallinarum]|uniref:Uncharacterized protein n=1 Tax=Staphylococcus gallinarum TaxID=1293 RepID=A0A380FLA3_STAGA|nr:Uncharacterised protein [Staphylococcus gallinarum]